MPALRSPRRTTVVLLGVLIPVGLAALIGMLLTWPGEARATHGSVVALVV